MSIKIALKNINFNAILMLEGFCLPATNKKIIIIQLIAAKP